MLKPVISKSLHFFSSFLLALPDSLPQQPSSPTGHTVYKYKPHQLQIIMPYLDTISLKPHPLIPNILSEMPVDPFLTNTL